MLGAAPVAPALAPSAAAGDRDRKKPSRVVIIMLDQARPDTIERYGMENVKELMRRGASFPNALVGHMAAETVVSHNVITSGLFPKHIGWSNEVHRDVAGVLGPPGDYYVTSSMSCDQFKALIEHGGYKKLPDYLDDRFGAGSKFVSLTQKRTTACSAGPTSSAADGTATDPEDIILQIRGSSAPSCDGASGWRQARGREPTRAALLRPRHAVQPLVDLAGLGRVWHRLDPPRTHLPARRQPLRARGGRDPAHLGGDT
jgi:hypothetical protein